MEIFVRTVTRVIAVLSVEQDSSVRSVKKLIKKQTGIAADSYYLLFHFCTLHDDNSLSYYGIRSGSELTLLFYTSW